MFFKVFFGVKERVETHGAKERFSFSLTMTIANLSFHVVTLKTYSHQPGGGLLFYKVDQVILP